MLSMPASKRMSLWPSVKKTKCVRSKWPSKTAKRAVVIEQEKVQRAKELEAVNRERDVEIEQINKEKALEEERKVIALTISERIAVEKKVAEEEERIKELREVSEADRSKQVQILEAEASAEQDLISACQASRS